MDIHLFSSPRADAWEKRPLHPGVDDPPPPGANLADYRRIVGFEPPGPPLPDGPWRRVADAILDYRAFPAWLVRGHLGRRPVQAGDLVVIEVPVVLAVFSISFGARVKETFDDGRRAGFTYQTLEGHIVRGVETFAVEKDAASGRVTASLTAWSVPAGALGRLTLPLMRFMQRVASIGALRNLGRIAEEGHMSLPRTLRVR